jgi:hypothetical protein
VRAFWVLLDRQFHWPVCRSSSQNLGLFKLTAAQKKITTAQKFMTGSFHHRPNKNAKALPGTPKAKPQQKDAQAQKNQTERKIKCTNSTKLFPCHRSNKNLHEPNKNSASPTPKK